MRRILVPVDGTAKGLAAVRAAIADGRERVDRIELVNVQPRLNRHIGRFLARRDRQAWREARAARAFEGARKLVETAGITCRTHAVAGPFDQAVADTARLLRASEIVVGTTQRGPLGRLLWNSRSAQLLESAGVPVRIIPFAPKPVIERLAIPVGLGMAALAFALDD
jgi:nucleotide-binding universal stress UspA family protein